MKEIVETVIAELSHAKDRQGNRSHSYMEIGNQFYNEQGAKTNNIHDFPAVMRFIQQVHQTMGAEPPMWPAINVIHRIY